MKFQAGDRVILYCEYGIFKGTIRLDAEGDSRRSIGQILVLVDGNSGQKMVAYPQQCRKLKKKERRRFWVSFGIDSSGTEYPAIFKPKREYDTDVEFIEVKKK